MTKTSRILSWFGVMFILAIGLIHVIDAKDSFSEAVYKGWLFYANGVGALTAAHGIYRKFNWGWNLGLLIAVGSFIGYVISRTIGLPYIPAEPDAWLEPLGIASLIAEGLFVMVFIGRGAMREKLPQAKALLFVFILLFSLPLCVMADDSGGKSTAEAKDSNRPRLDLDLYFWPVDLDGNISAGGQTAHTDIKFGDIIHDLKMGANGAFKVSKGDWFLSNDFLYMDISHKSSANIAPGASIGTTLDTRVFTDLVAVGRQWQNPVPWNLFMGARYFYGRVRLDAIEYIGPPNPEVVAVKTDDWVTPTIGAGVNLPFNDKLSLNFITDIGAADRSFNWEAVPTLCWKFNNTFTAFAGYRLLDIRHKEDNFKIDTLMHGPIIGAKVTF